MKYFRLSGHLFFGIFLVFSVLFYLERTVFLDGAYYLFDIIQSGTPNISGRYSALLTQILPWLAILLGLPLKVVLLLYSISFTLVFYLIYLLCVYRLKSDAAGIAIILSLCLCVRDSFYYPVSEIFLGLVLSALFFAWLYHQKDRQTSRLRWWGTAMLLILLCYYAHAVTVFTMLFSLGFYMIDQKKWSDKRIYLLAGGIVLLFGFKALLTSPSAPEGQEYASLSEIFTLIPDFFYLLSTRFLLDHSGNFTIIYVYFEVLLVLIILIYLWKREYLKIGLLLLTITSFLIVNNVIYAGGDSGIVMEKSFVPLGFFVGIPIGYDIVGRYKFNTWLLLVLLFTLLFLRIRDISKTSKTYTQRIEYVKRVCEFANQQGGQKFIIKRQYVNTAHIKVDWAFSLESLLISSLNGPESSNTIYITGAMESDTAGLHPDTFLHPPFAEKPPQVSDLNPAYFKIAPSTYQLINQPID